MRTTLIFTFLAIWLVSAAQAGTHAQDIEYLLSSVGASECVFIRNGKEHSAQAAEKHLRMKYRRGKKWVSDVESFISRIATKSSFSGKLYHIRCGNNDEMFTSDWLREKLASKPQPNAPSS